MSHIIWSTSSFLVLRSVCQPTLLQMYKYPQVLCSHLNREVTAKHSSSTFSCVEVPHDQADFTELVIVFLQHEIVSLKSTVFVNLNIQDTCTSKKVTLWAAQDIRKLLSWTEKWYILLTASQISLRVIRIITVWTAFKNHNTRLFSNFTWNHSKQTGLYRLAFCNWHYFQITCSSITHIINICQLEGTSGSSLWNSPLLISYISALLL